MWTLLKGSDFPVCSALQPDCLSNFFKLLTGNTQCCWNDWFLFFGFFSGESGLGKSTLINSLFLTDLYSAEYPGPSHRIKKTVQVHLDRCLFFLSRDVVQDAKNTSICPHREQLGKKPLALRENHCVGSGHYSAAGMAFLPTSIFGSRPKHHFDILISKRGHRTNKSKLCRVS